MSSLRKQYSIKKNADKWRLKDTYFTETKSESDTFNILRAVREDTTIYLSHDAYQKLPRSAKSYFSNPIRECILERKLENL